MWLSGSTTVPLVVTYYSNTYEIIYILYIWYIVSLRKEPAAGRVIEEKQHIFTI